MIRILSVALASVFMAAAVALRRTTKTIEWALGVALVMEVWDAKYRPLLADTNTLVCTPMAALVASVSTVAAAPP